MPYLYGITGLLLMLSFCASKDNTFSAIKLATKKFFTIIPSFLNMLIFISIVFFLIPDETILAYLGNGNKFTALFFATSFGSITLMPGFIAFPICGILRAKGISYMVLSAFTTTMMMVGILTYPIEKAYFGAKVTIIRNLLSLLTALIVALFTGLFFGELL